MAAIGVLLAVLSMLCWGISDFLLAKASRKYKVFRITIWFQAILLLLFASLSLFLYTSNSISQSTLFVIILTSLAAAAGNLSFTKAFKIGNVAVVAPVASSFSIVTLILSLVLFKEVPSRFQLLLAGMIIFGVILSSFKLKDLLKLDAKKIVAGADYAVITAISWGIYFFLLSLLTSRIGWFGASFLYNIPVLAFMFAYAKSKRINISVPKNALLLVISVALLNVVAIASYNLAVANYFTSIIAPIVSAASVVTVVLALLLLKEELDINQVFGIAIIILGVILLSF